MVAATLQWWSQNDQNWPLLISVQQDFGVMERNDLSAEPKATILLIIKEKYDFISQAMEMDYSYFKYLIISIAF